MPLTRLPLTDLTKIAEGIERPEDVVVSRDGCVFASVHQATVAEILPDGTFKHLGPKRGAPNGINIDHRGRIIVANFGIYDGEVGPLEAFDLETGARDILLAAVEGRTLTASNYPLSTVRATSGAANPSSAASWPEALDGRADGFIYILRPDGSSSIVADALKLPNGLAISADKRTLFCCQTTDADVLAEYGIMINMCGPASREGRLKLAPSEQYHERKRDFWSWPSRARLCTLLNSPGRTSPWEETRSSLQSGNKMNKIIAVWAFAILITGCVADTMRGYVGQDIRAVVLAYGPPVNEIDLGGGNRAFQWSKVSVDTTPGSAVTTTDYDKKARRITQTQFVGGSQTVTNCLYTFLTAWDPRRDGWIVTGFRQPSLECAVGGLS